MGLYSIKMRASKESKGVNQHISGAEKIVEKEDIDSYCSKLVKRALEHSKGNPDFINLKIEKVKEEEIKYLDALPVTTIETKTVNEGENVVVSYLNKLHINNIDKILNIWRESYAMRGAILLDVETLKRLEPDSERGIRATYMDINRTDIQKQNICSEKDHLSEALVLATKVVSHPNIIAELCISDDTDYVTGYIASKEFGYVRITTLKSMGSPNGGRVFLFNGSSDEIEDCIDYLEKRKVLINLNE